MAAKPKSQRMSFGWHRAEVLGAITSVLMIWVVTGILFYMAVLRVINQDFEIDANDFTNLLDFCTNQQNEFELDQSVKPH